jgi:hypothetical protein
MVSLLHKSKHKQFKYLPKEMALMLLSVAFGSYLSLSLQRILDNTPKLGIWKATMFELNTTWPSLLAAIALIIAAVALLWKHGNNEEMEELKTKIDVLEAGNKRIEQLLLILAKRKDNESGNKT